MTRISRQHADREPRRAIAGLFHVMRIVTHHRDLAGLDAHSFGEGAHHVARGLRCHHGVRTDDHVEYSGNAELMEVAGRR